MFVPTEPVWGLGFVKIGAILPHTLLFGGVKHYLEIGETFIARGHSYVLFTPDGHAVQWCEFHGTVLPLTEIGHFQFDLLMTSEEMFLEHLINSTARIKVFYVINENKALRRIVKNRDILFFANSTRSLRRIQRIIRVTAFRAFCGVNTDDFFPGEETIPQRPFVVMTYGRQSMRLKGTHLVTKACEHLYKNGFDIKLLLFDSVTDKNTGADINNYKAACPYEFVVNHPVKKNHKLYHRCHVFASAERKGTWPNTASEAMACGRAVIASTIGSDDFVFNGKTGLLIRRNYRSIARAIKRLYLNPGLRKQLATNGVAVVRRFQWRITADRILSLCESGQAHSMYPYEWPYAVNRFNVTLQRFRRKKFIQQKKSEQVAPGVYFFNYHDIGDEDSVCGSISSWRRANAAFRQRMPYTTSKERLEQHLKWLQAHATAITLTDSIEILARSSIDKAYFAVTFQGCFKSVLTHGLPVLKRLGVQPTLFVSTEFLDGRVVFLPHLIEQILHRKQFAEFQKELKNMHGIRVERPRDMERLIGSPHHCLFEKALREFIQKDAACRVHLDWCDCTMLASQGWTFGNSSASYACLSALSHEEQARQLDAAIEGCRSHDLPLIPWIAYPYGNANHVDGSTLVWMQEHPQWNGLFISGGVNLRFRRTEYQAMNADGRSLPELIAFIQRNSAIAAAMEAQG
ncbi:MAG: glycosyltransferase [Chitinivibrionales bacterium]|nr:glycosyltransferase [Chitinivibrionales bacterium]